MKKITSASEMPEGQGREETERMIIARLSKPGTLRDIENQFGYNNSEVSKIMQSAGVGCRYKKYTKPVRKPSEAEVVARLRRGRTLGDIAREFGYSGELKSVYAL